ncbi:hypothetical protein A2U01_0097418, partial [Trifolium medium]|nr:hypothetical protein [Trifolium medium]
MEQPLLFMFGKMEQPLLILLLKNIAMNLPTQTLRKSWILFLVLPRLQVGLVRVKEEET